MDLYILASIITRDPYEFTKIVKKLTSCEVKNLRANSVDNYINFEVNDIDVLFRCLEGFKEIFLTIDLRVYLEISSDKLNKLINLLNAKKMPLSYPYRIIAVISNGNYHLTIHRTSDKNAYLVRCLKAKNLDIVIPPSTFLFTGTLDTIRNDINRCIELLNKKLLQLNTTKIEH